LGRVTHQYVRPYPGQPGMAAEPHRPFMNGLFILYHLDKKVDYLNHLV
jgi:hypothetical protein